MEFLIKILIDFWEKYYKIINRPSRWRRRNLSNQFNPDVYISNNWDVSYEELPEDPMLIKASPTGWSRPTATLEESDNESQKRQLTVEDHLELE